MKNIFSLLEYPTDINKIHESCYRSFHVVLYLMELLREGTPPEVVLSLAEDLMKAPGKSDKR